MRVESNWHPKLFRAYGLWFRVYGCEFKALCHSFTGLGA